MKRWLLVVIGAGVFAAGAFSENANPVKVKVLKNNVNVRAKPVLMSETVGQVSENDELVVKSIGEEWVEIVPPPSVDLWVLGDYVKDGVIDSENVNVRAGAGINFSIVGQLSRGDNVVVRGTHAQWVSIGPPETCSLWIHSSLVEVIPVPEEEAVPETDKEAAQAELAEGESSESAAEPLKSGDQVAEAGETAVSVGQPESPTGPVWPSAIKAPDGLHLIPSPVQGQWKKYEGVLRPRGFFFRNPSRYRLVRYDERKKAVTICHVKGNKAQLNALLNRHMIISGREYWVQRSRYPVLVPERIVLKGQEAGE